MEEELSKYDKHIIKCILASNQFGITQVCGLVSIVLMNFVQKDYPEIRRMLQKKDIESLKKMADNLGKVNEYLDIMIFKDQNNKTYTTTVYDNNELWQDPQIIDIFPMQK